MGIINKLSDKLTNMIAAGEVVERPSGIVKELVDNSIDAKSKNITINIVDGGLESIEVIDDGRGMDPSDATMCFKRHATSKIKEEEDLFSIHTLGFRGEALPSIASVSEVEMKTSDGEQGTIINYAYAKLLSAKPCACNKGTRIKIEKLFYMTPARLKHLKSPQYETSIIHDVISKFALGYPDIAFNFNSNGSLMFKTNGNNRLVDVFFALYGKQIASNSFSFEASDFDYKISGLACTPTINRASRNFINIFINHRMIRSYRLNQAIIETYYHFMPKERYPIITLNIQMDESLVDVNVHPAKWEVRLSKETQLINLIKTTLFKLLKNDEVDEIVEPRHEVHRLKYDENYNANMVLNEPSVYQNNNNENNESKVYMQPTLDIFEEEEPTYNADNIEPMTKRVMDDMTLIGQLDGRYILTSSTKGLFIIDQHAAAERINFEYYLDLFNHKKMDTQSLLMPLKIHAQKSLISRIDDINTKLEPLKIHFELFGDSDFIIRDIPLWMIELKAEKFLEDLLDIYENTDSFNVNELTKLKIATIACHASIRFNHDLDRSEMQAIIDDLRKCENPFNCPHGRPTYILIDHKELERRFIR